MRSTLLHSIPAGQRRSIIPPAMIRGAAAVLAAAAFALSACDDGLPMVQDDTRYQVSTEGAPSLGKADAPVTIVEFVDIQCPYCSVSARRVKSLLKSYPDDLRIAFRHFPIPNLHPRAIPAAKAAECAEDQGLFWEMLDKLVADDASLSDDAIDGYAQELGMDMEAFGHCINTTPAQDRINADWQMGIDLEIHATPTLFVNGLRVVGLQTTERLAALVRSEAKAAREEADAGSPDAGKSMIPTDPLPPFVEDGSFPGGEEEACPVEAPDTDAP